MISKWIALQNFAEQYHPFTVITKRAVNIFNDNVMAHFRKASMHRKKTANIGQIFFDNKNHPKANLIGAKETENRGRRR